LERTRKLVDGLKANKAGTKLNEGPAKKLKEHLQSIEDGHELKSIADQMLTLLDGADAPTAKIQKLKDLLPSEAEPASDDESPKSDTDNGGDTA